MVCGLDPGPAVVISDLGWVIAPLRLSFPLGKTGELGSSVILFCPLPSVSCLSLSHPSALPTTYLTRPSAAGWVDTSQLTQTQDHSSGLPVLPTFVGFWQQQGRVLDLPSLGQSAFPRPGVIACKWFYRCRRALRCVPRSLEPTGSGGPFQLHSSMHQVV